MQITEVVNYYSNCDADYRLLWRTHHNYSMHYGFFDNEHRTHSSAVQNLNQVLSRIAGVSPQDKVLDAGCGVGGSSIWLAKNIGCECVGINLSEKQLRQAKNFARKEGVGNRVKFERGNFLKTDFPDEYFSLIWAVESVCHAEDKRAFFREAFRLLKKGGRLIVADGFLKESRLEEKSKMEINKMERGWALSGLANRGIFTETAEEAGFKNHTVINMTKSIFPSAKRMYLASFIAYPFNKLLMWMGLRNRYHEGNIIAAYYQFRALKRGDWEYFVFFN